MTLGSLSAGLARRLSPRAPLILTGARTTLSPATSPVAISALHTAHRFHGETGDRSKPLQVIFTLPDGKTTREVTAFEGQNLLDIAAENKLPMEGACAGSCACSTCHVYVDDDETMDAFPEPTDEENDMLDLAFFPQPNSRLGCQLKVYKSKHNGLKVTLPKATRNMYVDGATPTPH